MNPNSVAVGVYDEAPSDMRDPIERAFGPKGHAEPKLWPNQAGLVIESLAQMLEREQSVTASQEHTIKSMQRMIDVQKVGLAEAERGWKANAHELALIGTVADTAGSIVCVPVSEQTTFDRVVAMRTLLVNAQAEVARLRNEVQRLKRRGKR